MNLSSAIYLNKIHLIDVLSLNVPYYYSFKNLDFDTIFVSIELIIELTSLIL